MFKANPKFQRGKLRDYFQNKYQFINIDAFFTDIISNNSFVEGEALKKLSKIIDYPITKLRGIKSIIFLTSKEYNRDDLTKYNDVFSKILSYISKYASPTLAAKSITPQPEPDESEGGILDKFAFGDSRSNVSEPDNSFEKKLYDSLKGHFDSAGIDKVYADTISNFIKNGKYFKVFKAPTVEKVYRGMAVSYEWLKAANGTGKRWVLRDVGTVDKKFTWYPRNNASNWTKDITIARRFATAAAKGREMIPIIMIAYINDNKPGTFFDTSALYKLISSAYEEEKEVLSFGQVKVSKLSWFNADEYE